MKSRNQLRLELLEQMLEWRINNPTTMRNLEADALEWAISLILATCSEHEVGACRS